MNKIKTRLSQSTACAESVLLSALLLLLSVILSFPLATFAGDEPGEPRHFFKLENHRPDEVNFDCDHAERHQTLGDFLSHLNPDHPHTIRVSGACNENLVIAGFYRLTLLATPGASINDASGGTLAVIDVSNTSQFDFEGFTVNGGRGGINCVEFSTCFFSANTVQNSAADGVFVSRSQAGFHGDTIAFHASRGLVVANGGLAFADSVTVQNNVGLGSAVVSGGNLSFLNSVIEGNLGTGIVVSNHSTLRVAGSTIRENAGAGIFASGNSEVWVENLTGPSNAITHNAGPGVRLADLSFVQFTPGNNVTGNAGIDVSCAPQFPATRGALANIGGGTTNCIEP